MKKKELIAMIAQLIQAGAALIIENRQISEALGKTTIALANRDAIIEKLRQDKRAKEAAEHAGDSLRYFMGLDLAGPVHLTGPFGFRASSPSKLLDLQEMFHKHQADRKTKDVSKAAAMEYEKDRHKRLAAKCPHHPDGYPSLELWVKPDGHLGIRCHAGCSRQQVLESFLGIETTESPEAIEESEIKQSRNPVATVPPIDERSYQEMKAAEAVSQAELEHQVPAAANYERDKERGA